MVNQSIAGNRLLHDFVGKNGLERFDRDVLSLPQASHVIVLLGTNDIGYTRYSEEVFDEGIYAGDITVEDLIAGYRSLITKAHANNIRIIGGTLPPFQGSGHYSTTTETIRQAVNQWIRESGEFDDVIDFDLVLRDPQNTSKLNPALQADWLHPNDAGYEAMAETIPLLLFAL